MATTRAFAYNPSQNPIPGTDSYGTLVIGTSNLDFSKDYGGIKWWMGPDEDLGYVIGGVVSGGTHPSPVGDVGTVEFWRTENLTTEQFMLLSNQISGQYFTNTSDAITWLNNNGYWTSYDPLLITPTPSATLPLSPTPAVTPTPTVTPSSLPPLLLDNYSGASVAYSLRRINSSYSGSAIRVRRSSDNLEQDIGFVNNQLDTTALTSFVGANNGFVTAWYDQSGNGKTAFQSTVSRQPRIVGGGTIEYEGGKPSIRFITGASSSLITTESVAADTYVSTFFVNRLGLGAAWKSLVTIGAPLQNNNFGVFVVAGGPFLDIPQGSAYAYGKGGYPPNAPRIVTSSFVYNYTGLTQTSVFLGSTGTGYYVNGALKPTGTLVQGDADSTNTSNPLIIGSIAGQDEYNGHISELIIYKSNQNSSRSGIESNMNNYYVLY